MNKKQLIVAWFTTIINAITILSVIIANYDYKSGVDIFFLSLTSVVPLSLIGSLLIYTLRDKKK